VHGPARLLSPAPTGPRKGGVPSGGALGLLSVLGWAAAARVWAGSPLYWNVPGQEARLQMSSLPVAIYRVHFVHTQGLQSLLLVIKGDGRKDHSVLGLDPSRYLG
jgi:hypothetical protein